MLLLRVPGPGVGAALHQKERRLAVSLLIDGWRRLPYAATTGVGAALHQEEGRFTVFN
jgi:hypothetical protein